MTQSVLVTGANGYLGRNLVRDLVARGHEVHGLVRSPASAALVEALGAKAVQGDITDSASLDRAMAGKAWLIHAAADTNHGRGTRAQMRTNLSGTRNVYVSARKAGVERAVHISTEAVLMDGKPIVEADETWPIPKRSAGSYSRTKAAAERMALEHGDGNMDVVVVRPRFVWGRDDTTALPQLMDAAKTGRLVWIGGGRYLTSTTHIANVVEGVRLALEKGRPGEIYFLSDDDDIEFRTLVTDLLATQGVTAEARNVPRWLLRSVVGLGEMAATLTGGFLHGPMSRQEYATIGDTVTLNIAKAKTELGYRPLFSREEGLAELREMAAD